MSKNITIAGASYPSVPSIIVPVTGGGTASFVDTSGATASASTIMSGYTAYVGGSLVTGTASGVSATVDTATTTPSSNSTSISFSVSGEPIMFAVQISKNASYISGASTRYITSVICDGSTVYTTNIYKSGSSAREYNYSTSSFSYSGGTLKITSASSSTSGYFMSGTTYRLIYVY